MVFSEQIIEQLKVKSGLSFNKASDFTSLSDMIMSKTGQSIGVTTLKRLFGYIDDARDTNTSTLDIIAAFLGFNSWNEYLTVIRVDSDWNRDYDTIWVENLSLNSIIEVSYLNRVVTFQVVFAEGRKALKVLHITNSSLKTGDIAFIDKIRKGEKLEARKVCRGTSSGSYRTNGDVKTIKLLSPEK